MSDNWLPADEAGHQVCLQAESIALKLGHRLGGWGNHKTGRLVALCLQCLERVIVAPRTLHAPPMAGVPVQFECRPVRTPVGGTWRVP